MRRLFVIVVFLSCLVSLYAGPTNDWSYPRAATSAARPSTNRVPVTAAPRAVTTDDNAINWIMWRFQNAIRTNDFTYAVDVMYGPYLQKMGGREKALVVARAAPAAMQAQHVRFLSWAPLRPYSYATGRQRRYAIVRYEAVIDTGGKRTRVRSFLLGIKTPSAPWQFVNGDGLIAADFVQFFPDFPKTVVLPKPEAALMP